MRLQCSLAMRTSRRWLAALLLALGMLPGVERILLAHVHGASTPAIAATAPDAGSADALGEGWLDCAACHARATLDSLAIDAHPERHGAAPFAAPAQRPGAAPPAPCTDAPSARAPPPRIV
jgi:hypothetical protein